LSEKIDTEGCPHEERKLIESKEWSPPKLRAEKARAAQRIPDFETYATKWIAKRRTDKGEAPRASTPVAYVTTLELHLVPTFGTCGSGTLLRPPCGIGMTRPRTATPRTLGPSRGRMGC
jgi:hypothetical protein